MHAAPAAKYAAPRLRRTRTTEDRPPSPPEPLRRSSEATSRSLLRTVIPTGRQSGSGAPGVLSSDHPGCEDLERAGVCVETGGDPEGQRGLVGAVADG